MKKKWCIPHIDAPFRERMYDILDLYAEDYNPRRPVVGVDEKPIQLLGETRQPIPAKPGRPLRYDYEYTRNGTANVFLAVDFKGGRRLAQVTRRRTRTDFAHFMKHVVDSHPQAEKICVVLDNLNTHNETSFYQTFDEKEAQRLLKKIEFHYTPKHASWLNVAEIEIGVMDAQCTDKRIPDLKTLHHEVQAWQHRRNQNQKKIQWTFTKQKAEKKLNKYYVT